MTARRRVSFAIVVAGVSLAALAIGLKWRDEAAFFRPEILLSRFPAEDAAVLSVDVAALRKAGLLKAAASGAVEPEYRQFLDGTGFDYRRDLDLAVASFSKSGSFYIARGRFDWPKLRAYAEKQGGSCYQGLCRLQGSRPERHISFLPLRDDTIAMAVSGDDLAATKLTRAGEPIRTRLPGGPVWLSMPGAALREQGAIPVGLRVALSGLVNADRVVVTAGPGPNGLEIRMDAACRSAEDAGVLASQLNSATAGLKEALGRDRSMETDEMARALAAGRFDRTGATVAGTWPVRSDLIESLTRGI